ncbi:hypothetical protein N9J72_00150 [Candidatus Gracilibacteria bacterium]|nr:hypothetical protein [Candidatus Gracilibacteria bacterium]
MELVVDLIYSGLLMGGGYALIRYRRDVKSWTGNFAWAEIYIGRGSTYTIMILIAMGMIFLGVLYPFGGLSLITGSENSLQNPQISSE